MNYLGFKQDFVEVNQDNKSGIRIATSGEFSGNSKHFDVDFFYITCRIRGDIIKIIYRKTKDMIADSLTNALSKCEFYKFLIRIGDVQPTSNQEGASFKNNPECSL